MDPYAVLGVAPGASKADIKAAFRKKAKAHHPDMHSTASEAVQKAHDAAFRALNDAYQALMDDSLRYRRQRGGSAASAAAGFARASSYYAGSAGTGQYSSQYNPFASHYASGSYWGYRQYRRRSGGFNFSGLFRSLGGMGRAEAAATATLGLLLAGGALLLEPVAGSLWARNNEGKLFSSIEEDAVRRKQQRAEEAAAARAAAAAAAARAAAAAAAAKSAMAEQQAAAAAAPAPAPAPSNASSSDAASQALPDGPGSQQQQQIAASIAAAGSMPAPAAASSSSPVGGGGAGAAAAVAAPADPPPPAPPPHAAAPTASASNA